MKLPRTVAFDIENTPMIGAVWTQHEAEVLWVLQHSYILSFSYQVYPENTIHTVALTDFPNFKKDPTDDYELCKVLWKLFDEAEILLAQNGDQFDIKKVYTRFLHHRLGIPSPFKTIDTLKILRNRFGLPSNKLDEVCQYFNIGRKLPHTGKNLWRGCMPIYPGNPKLPEDWEKNWKLMKKYNAHDVYLLRKLAELITPWGSSTHVPNAALITGNEACPNPLCGSTLREKRGERAGGLGFYYQRYMCLNCGKWYRGPNIPLNTKIKVRPL